MTKNRIFLAIPKFNIPNQINLHKNQLLLLLSRALLAKTYQAKKWNFSSIQTHWNRSNEENNSLLSIKIIFFLCI